MSQNKNAQIRYKALDRCFSNFYKKFYIDDLIDYCSKVLSEHYSTYTTISRRQIFEDINFMKSEAGFDAPITSVKDGIKVFYRYSNPEYSILKAPLNPSELDTLNEALETLSRMNSLPGFDWVNSLQAKLKSGLEINKQEKQIISFEENEFLQGLEFLNTLYQYISQNQCIIIMYKSFKSEKETEIVLSPYYLKQYNNRWFLFGWNHEFRNIQNIALDRIKNINVSKEKFIENNIDFTEYFEDIVGVTNKLEEKVQIVKIKLSNDIIPYVISKPIHGSQKIKNDILELQLKMNYELESLILSYGEKMKVLEPYTLLKNIENKIKAMKDLY